MKKALLVAALLALAGCNVQPSAVTAENRFAYRSDGTETCYDGIVYVRFASGNGSWGSVKINKDTGSPVSCS